MLENLDGPACILGSELTQCGITAVLVEYPGSLTRFKIDRSFESLIRDPSSNKLIFCYRDADGFFTPVPFNIDHINRITYCTDPPTEAEIPYFTVEEELNRPTVENPNEITRVFRGAGRRSLDVSMYNRQDGSMELVQNVVSVMTQGPRLLMAVRDETGEVTWREHFYPHHEFFTFEVRGATKEI